MSGCSDSAFSCAALAAYRRAASGGRFAPCFWHSGSNRSRAPAEPTQPRQLCPFARSRFKINPACAIATGRERRMCKVAANLSARYARSPQPNRRGAPIQLEMKKFIAHLGLVSLASLILMSCAARETEIQTTGSTSGRAEGSGVTDARDVNGGPGASAAGAPIGHPGR